MSTFLSRILRSESKDKPKETYLKTRQFVAPPDWFDAYGVNPEFQNQSKQQKKNVNDKQKRSKEQRSGPAKSRSHVSSKNSKHHKRRQNKPLASWFCMSGNTDTLERAPQSLPENPNAKKGRTNAKDIKKNTKLISNGNPIARVYIRNDGKKKRDPKLRHSMPAQDWVTIDFKDSEDSLPEAEDDFGPFSLQPKRSLSPGVRYRVDGTLERPYVFPSGLTFGPEGRKLQLRRRHDADETQGGRQSSNEYNVQAQVHSDPENQSRGSGRDGEEYDDLRKAFYLKYDSDSRYSPPLASESPNMFEHELQHHLPAHMGQLSERNQNPCANTFVNKTDHLTGTDNTSNYRDCKLRQSRRSRRKNRYSMPPKNDDCVYMGSFENLHILDALSIDDRTMEKRRSGRKKDRRCRYSLPPMNSELVYMGSLENLNHFVNGGNKIGVGFSANVDDTVSSNDLTEVHPHGNSKRTGVYTDDKLGSTLCHDLERQKYEASGARPKRNSLGRKAYLQDNYRHSMPEIHMSTHLSVAKSTKSDGQEDSEDEDDFFDDSFPSDLMRNSSKPSPFSRNAGRSSCMPGNKRFEPPPACFDVPTTEEKGNEIVFRREENAFITPWKKRFSLPPPPDYTPPKEEMEKVYAHLSSTGCNKGSQTNLSVDCESLNMEDRDLSLKRTGGDHFYSPMSPLTHERTDVGINARRNLFLQQNNNSENTEQYEVMAPSPVRLIKNHPTFLDLSQGSDDVFRDTLSNISFNTSESTNRAGVAVTSHTVHISDPGNDYNTTLIYPQSKENSKEKATGGENHHDVSNRTVLTSTPVVSRRPKRSENSASQASQNKPVPTPRKRYSLPGTTGIYVHSKHAYSNTETNKTPPVPKRRQSTLKDTKLTTTSHGNRHHKNLHQSNTNHTSQSTPPKQCVEKQTSPTPPTEKSEIYNVYEEVDTTSVSSVSNQVDDNHHYEECGYLIGTEDTRKEQVQDLDQILPALEEIQLASSPRPHRKFDPEGGLSRPHYTGLSSSVADLLDIFDREVEAESRCRGDDTDDDSNADDEMSGCNDDEDERVVKKRSLRKSFSASDLLRSGSILDRSMIQAKKRRHRMRGRKCRSQLFSSTENEDDMDCSSNETHAIQQTGSFNSNFRFLKPQSLDTEQPLDKKLNQTDSGHDSDGMSPCTSPGNQSKINDMTAFEEVHKLDDPCSQRGGTLTKKPWQIRLRNKQFMRRSRSKENLVSNTHRLKTLVVKPDLDTLV